MLAAVPPPVDEFCPRVRHPSDNQMRRCKDQSACSRFFLRGLISVALYVRIRVSEVVCTVQQLALQSIGSREGKCVLISDRIGPRSLFARAERLQN